MIKIIKPVFVFTLLSIALVASAQNNTHSPYSARGYGEPEPFITAYNRSLGGTFNGIRSTRFISLSNPASVSSLKQVVFDFGFSGASGQLTSETARSTYYNGNFSYIVLGFPMYQKEILEKDTAAHKNKAKAKTSLIKTYRTIWGSAIGLTPYSNIGSSYYKTVDTGYGKLANYYTKSGGLSNFFIMNSVNVKKNVSIGLNAGYIFGQVRTNKSYIIGDSGISRALDETGVYNLRGFKFDLGVQAQHYDTFLKRKIGLKLDKKDSTFKKDTTYKKIPLKFVFGATMTNLTPLNFHYNRQALNKSNYFLTNPIDTVINADSSGKTYLPRGFSAGFSIKYNNLWLIAFDYSTNLLATQKKTLFSDVYTNSSQFSLGLAYKPDQDVERMNTSRAKKLKTNFEYRLGLRYFNTGYNFKDNQGTISPLKEYGISAGIGIPLLKRSPYTREVIKSSINLTMEYIHRGTTKHGMVDEALYKLTIGVTLGDIWFTKKKFY